MLLEYIIVCLLHFHVYESIYGQNILYMDNDLTNGKLQISCTVDKLIYNVDIKYPNTDWGFATCIAPTSLTKTTGSTCDCACQATATCYCNITQNIDKKLTILNIFDSNSNLNKMNGSYSCQHGSNHESIKVDATNKCPEHKVDEKISALLYITLASFGGWPICILIGYYICKKFHSCDICRKHQKLQRQNAEQGHIQNVAGSQNVNIQIGHNNQTTSSSTVNEEEYTAGENTNFLDDPDIKHETTFTGEIKRVPANVESSIESEECKSSQQERINSQSPGNMELFIKNPSQKQGLTTLTGITNNCYKCKLSDGSLYCLECTHVYCDICFELYRKHHTRHHVEKIKLRICIISDSIIACDKCTMKADRICRQTRKPTCEICASHHYREKKLAEMMIMYSVSQNTVKQQKKQEMTYYHNISIKKEKDAQQICGITFIKDGRIVLVDGYSWKLIVFDTIYGCKAPLEKEFRYKPRAMTAMTDNNIAITFADEMQIRIYRIDQAEIYELKTINLNLLSQTKLQPFCIAYDKDVFVVEAGDGDVGKIFILDQNSVCKTIKNLEKVAFFTGNTIRLALDVKKKDPLEGKIFISALGKMTVSCIDFEGNMIWSIPICSPRSLIVNPEGNIIMSSKNCNAIYAMSKDGKNLEVLLDGDKIKSPRFIAYNSSTKQLCCHCAKNNEEEVLVFFKSRATSEKEFINSSRMLKEHEYTS